MRVLKKAGVFGLLGVALLAAGCGGITRSAVDHTGGVRAYHLRTDRRIRVSVGSVSADKALDAELRDAVARYLQHQVTVAAGQHDLFAVVDTRSGATDLLGKMMQTEAAPASIAGVDGRIEVEVLQLQERKGPTVRVGLVSQQSKYATARVRVRLVLDNGRRYEATADGKASKGAWGAVAMTDRKAMDRKGGVWELDGSMAGSACAEALQASVADMARQLHADVRRLKGDELDQWL
jgi:hypothetical protein